MAYFPNGTAGEVLDDQCAKCPLGQGPCPITWVQMTYNYDQCDNPKLADCLNDLVDEKGQCKLKPLLEQGKMPMPTEEDSNQHPTLGATNKPMKSMEAWLKKQNSNKS